MLLGFQGNWKFGDARCTFGLTFGTWLRRLVERVIGRGEESLNTAAQIEFKPKVVEILTPERHVFYLIVLPAFKIDDILSPSAGETFDKQTPTLICIVSDCRDSIDFIEQAQAREPGKGLLRVCPSLNTLFTFVGLFLKLSATISGSLSRDERV